jgi:prenyltransferase beta subunit
MLQVARVSPRQLGESAALVEAFLRAQQNDDGGFRDRSGKSDLYYTVFGLEGLLALRAEMPAGTVSPYLRGFGAGDELDLVHLGCLIRCWADLCKSAPPLDAGEVAARIEAYRTPDGGYHTAAGAATGTVYGCFVALAAYQDLRQPMPSPKGVMRCLRSLRRDDGGFANQRDVPMGTTPASTAAEALYRHLGEEPPAGLSSWLLARCGSDGGFFAGPRAPVPDLLSTATALHALAGMKAPIEHLKERCLDFIDSLWTNAGGFYGHWADDAPDCEYTYYGLLALGYLSL